MLFDTTVKKQYDFGAKTDRVWRDRLEHGPKMVGIKRRKNESNRQTMGGTVVQRSYKLVMTAVEVEEVVEGGGGGGRGKAILFLR